MVGPVELALALRAGCPPERIVVNGVGQTDPDLAAAADTGALVNAETLGALDTLLEVGAARIGLRINPALDAQTHPHLATGAAGSKFGISLDELSEALRRIRVAGGKLESIGAHIGSEIADLDAFRRLAELLARLASEAGAQRVDLGGGWIGAPEGYAAAIGSALPEPGLLIVEPGRSIVGDAGWLVTRVVRIQARGHLVVDAGMTELIRPMLYGAEHPVSVLAPGGPLPTDVERWTLAGPICEAGDLLARDVDLGPMAGVSALLAIGSAGAYGAAMASSYNGRLRPAQAVIEEGELRLSRRRETFEDFVVRDS